MRKYKKCAEARSHSTLTNIFCFLSRRFSLLSVRSTVIMENPNLNKRMQKKSLQQDVYFLYVKVMVLQINRMVPLVGFELTTYRLQGGCSTN